MKKYGREYYGNYLSSDVRSIVQLDNNFYLSGFIQNESSTGIHHTIFSEINLLGELVSFKIDSSFSSIQLIVFTYSDNYFYAAGRSRLNLISSSNTKVIRKMNLNGETIWTKSFGSENVNPLDNIIYKIYAKHDKIVVFGTSYDGVFGTNAVVSIFNSEGEEIVTHSYTVDQNNQYANLPISSIQTNDGFLFVLQSMHYPENEETPSFLLKINDLGQELWRKDLANFPLSEKEEGDTNQSVLSVFKMQNNHIGVAFELDKKIIPGNTFVPSKRILVEFDEYGNFIKSNEFYSDELLRNLQFEFTNNNEIIVFGNYTDEYNQLSVFASKLDQNFNVLWRKNFGFQEGGGNRLTDAQVTKDNGFVMLGSKLRNEFPFGFDYFIIKTDCNGNLEWDNQSCVVSSEEDVIVFGNPVQDEWLMHFPQLNADDVVEYELVNSIGQIVLKGVSQGPIFNETISNLSVGMYAFQLQFSGGKSFVGKVMKY